MIRIEQWTYHVFVGSKFDAPECAIPTLAGVVYGHPCHADGKLIRTSQISGWDADLQLVKTVSGSNYQLGEPDVSYEAAFPNAKQRLIEAISGIKQQNVEATP